jgi:OOP family OmpA-OmpF porin
MLHQHYVRQLLGAGVMAFAAGTAAAAESGATPGWYGGASIGRSDFRLGGGEVDSALGGQGITSSSTIDDKRDTAYKLNLGYQFNRNFGIEGGYVDLGRSKFSSTTTAPGADTLSGEVKARGWTLEGVGTLPLGNGFSVFGKAGVLRADLDFNAGSTGVVAVSNREKTTTSFTYGLGAGYDISKSLGLRAEWNRYSRLGESATTGKGDVDLFSAGVVLKF